MVLPLLSLLIPAITGYCVAAIFLPFRDTSGAGKVMRVTLAAGLAAGGASLSYFLNLVAAKGSALYLVAVESALLLATIFYMLKTQRSCEAHPHPVPPLEGEGTLHFDAPGRIHPDPSGLLQKWVAGGFYLFLAIAVGTFSGISFFFFPEGRWDAWQTWNLLARLIHRGGAQWRETIAAVAPIHHPDYPLLVPGIIARVWGFYGETRIVPMLLALLFTFGTVSLTVSAVALLRTRTQGYLAGLALLGTTNFILLGSYQYADVPLGFFFLAVMVLLALQEERPGGGPSLLAGVLCGMCCWTKNEGMLFTVAVVVACCARAVAGPDRKEGLKNFLCFCVGIAPVLFVVAYHKAVIAPPNDIVSAQGEHTFERLLQLERYLMIAKEFVAVPLKTFPVLVALALYACFLGVRRERETLRKTFPCAVILAVMAAGYFMVYLVSPHDLSWHLETSLNRLMIQLWPSFLFLYFLFVRAPGETAG